MWPEFAMWQWALFISLFCACVAITEYTMREMKLGAIWSIMMHHRDAGMCSRCLMRERDRLLKLSYASVEVERIRLHIK